MIIGSNPRDPSWLKNMGPLSLPLANSIDIEVVFFSFDFLLKAK